MKKEMIIIAMVALSVNARGQAERKFIRQGNKLYDKESYDESEVSYRKALEKDGDSYVGEFNLADALYKQKKYEEAGNKFGRLAANEEDKQKLGALYHNLGNSLLQSGKIEQSIEAYENALRNNPGDLETKHNLAYAQRMLNKQNQQKENNKNQKENQDQKQKPNQNKENKNNQKENQDKQQQQNQNKENGKNRKEDQGQQQQAEKISKEDARRILEALKLDEMKVQEKIKKELAQQKKVKVLKDW